jgi:signal transduction histidine kinase
MNSLSARIAVLLGAVFLVMAALLVAAMQAEETRSRLHSVEAMVGVVGLSLLAAWCALWPLTRRIARLGEALDTHVQGGFAAPLRLPDADAHGDEIARLAARAEQVSQHIASQAATLAQAGRQRRELLANVSHDLRTPLASMQGYLELLLLRQGSLEPAEAHNYLQTAARQSERLGRLVGDLFELTRLEAEDMQPQAEPFVLAELAQDVVQRFAPDAHRREVALSTFCEAEPGGEAATGSIGAAQVQADIALIERVLANLVDNALRHTPAGGVVAIAISGDEAHLKVAVRDSGEGIAAEDLPGIFERYDRATRVGDSGAGHAGLGLAIAHRIVKLHGSALQVQSVAGQGTRVGFELARAERRPGIAGAGGMPQRGRSMPA